MPSLDFLLMFHNDPKEGLLVTYQTLFNIPEEARQEIETEIYAKLTSHWTGDYFRTCTAQQVFEDPQVQEKAVILCVMLEVVPLEDYPPDEAH